MENTGIGLASANSREDAFARDVRLIALEDDFASLAKLALAAFLRVAVELKDEADSREWCDEYDRFVARVNRELSDIADSAHSTRVQSVLNAMRLEPLAREFDVETKVVVTFTGRVVARDEDEAVQAWQEQNNLRSLLMSGDWEDAEMQESEASEV